MEGPKANGGEERPSDGVLVAMLLGNSGQLSAHISERGGILFRTFTPLAIHKLNDEERLRKQINDVQKPVLYVLDENVWNRGSGSAVPQMDRYGVLEIDLQQPLTTVSEGGRSVEWYRLCMEERARTRPANQDKCGKSFPIHDCL